MVRILRLPWLAPLLALLAQGCCYQAGERARLFAGLDELLDNYAAQQLTSRSCYSLPTQSQRDTCYQQILLETTQLALAIYDFKRAFVLCESGAMEAALNRIDAIAGGVAATQGNLSSFGDQMDMQAQGNGSGDMGTTVTLTGGATLRVQLVAGGTIAGPMALAGSFAVDLQALGTLLRGPVTALAITGTATGYPTWQIDLVPSPQNVCSLLAPVAGIRRGDLTAAVRLSTGNMGFRLLLRLPVQVSADLASWNLATGTGLVPAAPFLPRAQQGNVRLRPGCAGTSGIIPAVAVIGVPRVGDPLTLSLNQARASSVAVLCIGESSSSHAGIPLPFDLGVAGAPGCLLRVSLALLLSRPTTAVGEAEIVLPIPNDAGLVGAPAFHQWLVLDPANSLGLVASDGIRTSFNAR